MGYVLIRRYIINADSDEELYQEAIKRADPDVVGDLEAAAYECTGDATALAASVLCSMADVGDATDIVRVYDENVHEDSNVHDYFPRP